MGMFGRVGLLAIAGTLVATTPAGAARLLYSYADTAGNSITAITTAPLSGFGDVSTIGCVTSSGVFCDSAGYVALPFIFGLTPNADQTDVLPSFSGGANMPGIYGDGVRVRLRVQSLADSDWVFAYVDTRGNSITAVTSGPLSGFGDVATATCRTLGTLCDGASYIALSTPSIFGFTPNAPRSDVLGSFGGDAARVPGTYGLGAARLTVVGAAVVSVAPEPAAWLLMLVGFGLAGGMLRRGRQAGAFAAT